MDGRKKAPSEFNAFARRFFEEGADHVSGLTDELSRLPDRLARYAQAYKRATAQLQYLVHDHYDCTVAAHAAKRLAACGNYLVFREYYTVGKVRLHAAEFCRQHLICPLCAIRRGSKTLAAYLQKHEVVRAESPHLKLYMITFTVRHTADDCLLERHDHCRNSLKRLTDRRRKFLNGSDRAVYTELAKAAGGVFAYEVTHGKHGWHPHVHMLALCESAPDQEALRAEWLDVTGDSVQVDVRAGYGDPAESFMEVLKYAVKFGDLSPAQTWHAACTLRGKRLLGSFGCMWGVKVPEALTDEPLEDLPYFERFYRWVGGDYTLTGEVLDHRTGKRDFPKV